MSTAFGIVLIEAQFGGGTVPWALIMSLIAILVQLSHDVDITNITHRDIKNL
jgi:hypothetical protein